MGSASQNALSADLGAGETPAVQEQQQTLSCVVTMQARETEFGDQLSVIGALRDGLRIYLWEKHKAGLEDYFAKSGKVALLVHGGR